MQDAHADDDTRTQRAPSEQDATRPASDRPSAEELARGDWPNLEQPGQPSPADKAYATRQKPSDEQLASDLEAEQAEEFASDEAIQEGLFGSDQAE